MKKKHISLAENAHTAHIFYYLTIGINSQHPHLLGFDSNLIPNFNILLFQPYFGEDSEYLEQFERFACISAFLLGITQIIGKFIRLDLFFLHDTEGSTANTKYIDYSMDLRRITRIFGKIIKRSSEMAKIAIPIQEISENLEQSLYFLCADREKLI